MAYLNLTRRSNVKIVIDIQDDSGNVLHQRLINRYNQKDIQWINSIDRELSIPEINNILNSLCEDENLDEPVVSIEFTPSSETLASFKPVTDSPISDEPFNISIRELTQLKQHSKSFTNDSPSVAFRQVLEYAYPWKEPIIEWTDKQKFACLDIDYHSIPLNERPSNNDISAIASSIQPQPFCWHHTHGKGCKLYYEYRAGYTALELAAVAGLHWSIKDCRATFDIIKATRHPCYNRTRDNLPAPCQSIDDIHFTYGLADLLQLKRLLTGELDYSDIQEYLSDNNLVIGQSLPHNRCLIDPKGNTPEHMLNVFVGETGIFCHRCSSRGYTYPGSNTPGFISYATLTGTCDNALRLMAKHFVHLEHAKIVLANLYPNIPIHVLEIVYSVLLKLIHQDNDPRIKMTLIMGKGFVRTRGMWVDVTGEHPLASNEIAFVKSLPAVLIPTDDGFTVNVSAMTSFTNSLDLSDYGYQDITFIRGCKIYGQFLPYRDEIIKVITRKEFSSHKPTYIPLQHRMPVNEAWGLLEQEFPGIDHNYVRLLIAAKGASEGRLCQCPFLLINGVSGAGKSTAVHIAAGICGDKAEEPIFVPFVERFRQSLKDAAKTSGFICVNEVFKLASHYRLTPTQALDPMLSLTEDSRSHEMYVGSVPFGRLPVFVLTDINTPQEIEEDLQLSRRFTFYRLDTQNFWEKTFIQKRIRPHEFRLISFQHNEAANSILSEVIDRFFRVPMSLSEIATQLDIHSLKEYHEEITNKDDTLIRLYKEVITDRTMNGPGSERFPYSKGWRIIDRSKENTLKLAWEDVNDGQLPEQWTKSRLVSSKDWAKILNTPFPIICELRIYKNQYVYIRFRSNDSPSKPKWINGV